MSGSTSDLITYVALSTKSEVAAPGYTVGDSSVSGADLSVWPDGSSTGVFFCMDIIDANGKRIDGTYTEWFGIRSGNTIGSLRHVSGTDQDYPAGSTSRIMMLITAAWANGIVEALLKEHKSTGLHGAVTADSLVVAGNTGTATLSTTGDATIAGNLAAEANVTVTGLLLAGHGSVASGATITPAADVANSYSVTALAANATIAAPAGTPVDGQSLTLRIKDDGTSRTLTWNAIYQVIGVTLPTATVAGKILYVNLKYNAAASKWDVLAIGKQA